MKTFILMIIVLAGYCATTCNADVIFYVNDDSSFNAATSNMTNLGIEDFESSTLNTGQVAGINDPLLPGVANGALPFGTNADLGMTIQSNVLAGNATTTAPWGMNGLATYADGFGFSPTDQLTTQFQFHSLDLIFMEDTTAVKLLPLFVDSSGNPQLRGDVGIDVYDSNNQLVGSTIVSDASFFFTDIELGIVATGNTDIGRINLFDGNATQHWQGVDDVEVFTLQSVPEPSSLGLLAMMVTGFAARRRSRFGQNA